VLVLLISAAAAAHQLLPASAMAMTGADAAAAVRLFAAPTNSAETC
jgi:hypothetical protein